VIFGTGCQRNYPALPDAGAKMSKFMEMGGTILVFGQPEEWPGDLFPISIVSYKRTLFRSQLEVNNGSHPVFERTPAANVLRSVSGAYMSYPAAVHPADILIASGEQTAVLTESKIKKGKLIYCGLPLPEMFKDLDNEAISFFSNLINYSGK
jgi:hypothetical protein